MITTGSTRPSCANRIAGFTLVEMLIVLVILGIMAVLVIPQFSNASAEVKVNALRSQLQKLRTQIELYRLQHDGDLPDITADWTTLTTSGTFNGKPVGPYLQGPAVNSLNGRSNVVDGGGTAAAATPCGFIYDFTGGTGRIWATDTDGVTPLAL